MINAATFSREMRKQFGVMLRKYFDGTYHTFGQQPIKFPNCDVVFDRPQFGAPITKPVIYCEGFQDRSVYRKKNDVGIVEIFEQPYRFIVFTADKGKIWDVNFNVADLIGVVLNGGAPELDQDIRVIRVATAVPIALDPSQEFQVTQRMAIFKIKVQFGGAATGSNYAFVTGGIA